MSAFMDSNNHIYNRELSWLTFNDRVLQEAQDESVPLVQRLRFLGIFSNNQDEFIKVRVANLMRLTRIKDPKILKQTNGYTATELLALVNQHINHSQKLFEQTYTSILSEMEQEGIYILNETQLSKKQKEFCRNFCSTEISQWLIPLMLRKTTQMPFLSGNKVYYAVKMSRQTSSHHRYAILQLPINNTCKRFIELPSEKGRKDIIFIDDIMRLCLDEIFFVFNYDTISAHSFKFIRDAELTVDDDISKSLIEKMEDSLEERKHGEPVRLVFDKNMPEDLQQILASKLRLTSKEILPGGRYQMMRDLMKFPKVDPALEYDNPKPLTHPALNHFSGIFEVIKKQDIFLNYPYHTFNHVIDFLREAAIDPKVKRIFITLYRTAEPSKVINALINAAKNGKEVIVLEELMARFDEEQNVENSDIMQKAGITVIHGFKGLKVHSKLILIERKENGANKGYMYVGTGNFNETTARIYSDFGLLTTDAQAVTDARAISDFLLNTHKHFRCKRLIVSPYFMRKQFETLIEREIHNRKKGKEAFICAKFNSLTDIRIIKQLYKASQAGVEIKLIIRGACCLIPGIKGISDNIKVISIVDKYLEHARLAIFHNDGEDVTYILSADWMTRNLDNRVEVGIPILDAEIRKTIKEVFDIQWADNIKARELTVPGKNNYVKKSSDKEVRSQTALYDYYKQKENIWKKKF